jgi:hypothetical protein
MAAGGDPSFASQDHLVDAAASVPSHETGSRE